MMSGPLEGVKVFDLTLFMVGPWASMHLGAMGADVIHVEGPESVHGRPGIPPHMKGFSTDHILFALNKRSIYLDLKRDEDRQAAYRIIQECDVFIENMRPGVVERLGVGYEDVSRINPRIVYVSNTGWGREGPMAGMPAIDTMLQAFSGWCSITGTPGEPPQIYRHHTQMDGTTGNYIVQAVLLGLLARDATNKGQRIDVSMLRSALMLQTSRLAEYFATGKTPGLYGSGSSVVVPHQAFLCQDKQYVAVGVVKEEQWAPLCEVLELSHLINDSRFATNRARVENRETLLPILESAFVQKPRYYWVMRLGPRGVPCGKFMDWDEIRYHPQVTENEHVVDVETPWGRIHSGGTPWKFSETPGAMRPPSLPGSDTTEVFEEYGLFENKDARVDVDASTLTARTD
jgi:crotonobetainyl-CoA:carnitine CoA-transferase CaiB-like acyl-CoA transferase